MNKRYQVFVSSTFQDLKEERNELMQALLELDCMPAGMELFPAANEEQWGWIKKVIDQSDYYLVVIANRYGSISEATGMSYTEMEYRYAIDIGIPVIAFLHENPGSIADDKSEPTPAGKKKLEQFRALCKTRLVKYWTTPADLGAKASRSITQLIKHEPAVGWIRANEISQDQSSVILDLKSQIDELKGKLKELSAAKEPIEGLAQGGDELLIDFSYETKNPKTGKNGSTYWTKGEEFDHQIETTWDDLFAYLAPEMLHPVSEYRIVGRINQFIEFTANSYFETKHNEKKIEKVRVYSDSFDKIKIQFRAIGLIEIDHGNDWGLTDKGDSHMNDLLATKKNT